MIDFVVNHQKPVVQPVVLADFYRLVLFVVPVNVKFEISILCGRIIRPHSIPLQSLNLHPNLHILQIHLHAVGDRVGDGQGGAEGFVADVLLEGL